MSKWQAPADDVSDAVISYLLRDVPTDLWRQVKAKAALQGEPVRSVILRLLREYLK